ncbi:hypothetical protein [Actinomadura flavalba]|uniref:hypothetical protein n=1 Tax=Actinomadura flavalba TaxID=1120938 RepID=UPI00037A5672|nr:hypothetical protein [Actinomadura flavalba]
MIPQDSIDIELPHGYRLQQINRFAWAIAGKGRYSRHIKPDEAAAIARSAMLEVLYSSDTPPESVTRLINLGAYGIQRHIREMGRMYGRNLAQSGAHPTIRAHTGYWHAFTTGTGSHENTIIEAHAVHQILAALHPNHRRTIEALAEHSTHPKAAEALNMPASTFNTALWRARHEFYRLWHEGETPTTLHRTTRRPRKGDRDTARQTPADETP